MKKQTSPTKLGRPLCQTEIAIARRTLKSLWEKHFPDAKYTVRNIRKALSSPQVSKKEEWEKLNSCTGKSLKFCKTAIQILESFEDRYL